MANAPRKVLAYSEDVFRSLLTSKSQPDFAARQNHLRYFLRYFQHVKTQTIVVENEYVDHDYLEDFSAYYVRCFSEYERKCTRLHFFKEKFTSDDFNCLLGGRQTPLTPDMLAKTYLGFIVLKPLPQTIIGRTCLATYDERDGRSYPIKRSYKANLFGLDLEVESLAFQEQDSVVAACATSALWSVFQGTGHLFHHAIPSPVEITRAASVNAITQSRCLPNHGLSLEQMSQAIRSVGLEPFAVGVSDEFILRSTVYAYLKCRIPIILGVVLWDVSNNEPKLMGRHAVAVTGFRLDSKSDLKPAFDADFQTTATRIDRLYAHDDGIGPFARMLFDPQTNSKKISLTTSWATDSGIDDKVRAEPEVVLIPVYHKIRIPFGRIQTDLMAFDSILNEVRKVLLKQFSTQLPKIEWDVYLTTVNDLRRDLFANAVASVKFEALTRPMPKYIWRATAIASNTPVFELLFDATDIEQGRYALIPVFYQDVWRELLLMLARDTRFASNQVLKVFRAN
jgi:hypothetical protein